jgi:hypothetical protein
MKSLTFGMNKIKITYKLYFLFTIFSFWGCTEEFIPSTENFEDLLVVETTITDEFKFQKIKLTNTYTFKDSLALPVTNAKILIKDNFDQEYLFQYKEEDTAYLSLEKFKAEPNNSYQLYIETASGENYESLPETLPPVSNLEVQLSKENIDDKFGASFKVNSTNPINEAIYYRYEYQEAYKVIAPYWGPNEAIYVRESPFTTNYCYISYQPRQEDDKVCYTVKDSKEIILATTSNQSESNLSDFLIKFVPQSSWRSAHRYALKVNQYVIDYDTYNYYRTLKKISGSGENENTLSPNQPGFLQGNIKSTTSDKKILGYFEIASYSSERIFFNYDDLYPNEPKPEYYIDCNVEEIVSGYPCGTPPLPENLERLMSLISFGNKSLFKIKQGDPWDTYFMVETPCSKCTSISSNEIPDFWYE